MQDMEMCNSCGMTCLIHRNSGDCKMVRLTNMLTKLLNLVKFVTSDMRNAPNSVNIYYKKKIILIKKNYKRKEK
jgi:hypothetical protein